MLTNTDITICSRAYNPSTRLDGWRLIYIPEAWWFKDSTAQMTTDGMKSSDSFVVRIPGLAAEVKKGDYAVRGTLKKMETVKDLEHTDHFCVTGVNYNRYGDESHIKAVGV